VAAAAGRVVAMTDWRSAGPTDEWRERVQAALAGVFVLERELNGGTTSRVFVGSETALCRQVVIKLLAPDASGTEQEAEFRREAMTAARLHHPHIVPVFTVGTVAGVPYYTMPFIEGESLRARLDRGGALPVPLALRVLREIGSALAFAHELGVIHRDVKPENIALERVTGRALLGDFGIACSLGHSRQVTPAGTTVGTPVYMSPEQVDGLELDGRTDIYSLGLVAWEMLTGRRPWAGESLQDVMYRQKHDPLPSLVACGADVPRAVADAIERALQKDRGERWQSVGDLLAAVDLSVPPSTEARKSATRRGRAAREATSEAWIAEEVTNREAASLRDPDATVAMPVWRRQHAADHADPETPGWYASGVTRPRETTRELVTRRLRWVLASCGAVGVTAGLIAAMSFRHDLVRWSTVAGDVASRTANRMTGTVYIDTVSMDSAAVNLGAVQTTVPPPPAPETIAHAASAMPIALQPGPASVRVVPAASDGGGLSPHDAIRARAATATLALEAYQGAIHGITPTAAAAATTVTPISTEAAPSAPVSAASQAASNPGAASSVVGPRDSLAPAAENRARICHAP
jgi:hypothetical protein